MSVLDLNLSSHRKITQYCLTILELTAGFGDIDAGSATYFKQGYISALLDEGRINQDEHDILMYEVLERDGKIPFNGCEKCSCKGEISDPEFFKTWSPGDENFNCGIPQVACPECKGRGRL